jgi:hypothetical protein
MKAIETRYRGRRFRSRLEARWATFFDWLDISWEYEKEGYELDGMQYLPDFWLPEQDCWFEVKGQKPTEEEQEKARRLGYYTGKNVYIRYGDIWPDNSGYYVFPGIQIEALQPEDRTPIKSIEMPYQLARALDALERKDIFFSYSSTNDGILSVNTDMISTFNELKSTMLRLTSDETMELISTISNSANTFRQIAIEEDLPFFAIASGHTQDTYEHQGDGLEMWRVCKKCKSLGIVWGMIKHTSKECHPYSRSFQKEFEDNAMVEDAYIAAAQARFEFGETPN